MPGPELAFNVCAQRETFFFFVVSPPLTHIDGIAFSIRKQHKKTERRKSKKLTFHVCCSFSSCFENCFLVEKHIKSSFSRLQSVRRVWRLVLYVLKVEKLKKSNTEARQKGQKREEVKKFFGASSSRVENETKKKWIFWMIRRTSGWTY